MLKLAVGGAAWLAAAGVAVAAPDAGSLARGAYIVNHLAGCGDCHTAHDRQGQPVAGAALKGAPLAFGPLHPMPWADRAPPIAGHLHGHSKAEVSTLLQTGHWPGGGAPRPPMPNFGMTKADADAVTDYLASLRP